MPIKLLRLLAVLALILLPASAHAKRLALVIGIDSYEALPKLERAVNDADAIANALQGLGFEVVLAKNATRREVSTKLGEIEKRIAPGDTALFYFAGHGVAIGGDNILIPADMPLPEAGGEGIVRDEGFAVDGIVRRLRSRGAGATLLILDACRNNPFEESGTRDIGGTRGLTRVEAASGVFVLMSAGTGQTALDRMPGDDTNPNSVFTRSLLPLLAKPGMSHIALAKSVQKEVAQLAASAGHVQQPAYYDEILGEIVLNESGATAPEAVPAPAVSATAEALAEWTIVQSTTSRQVLEEFIAKHGGVPIYGALAKEALARLDQASEPESPPTASEAEVAIAAPEIAVQTEPASAAPTQTGATDCDRLAAPPGAASTAALGLTGVADDAIDAPNAVAACFRDQSANPGLARVMMTLGRALAAAGRMEESVAWYRKAAAAGELEAKRVLSLAPEAEPALAVAPEASIATAPVTQCDRLAAAPGTPITRGLGLDGVKLDKIDAKTAIDACQQALAEHPGVARLHLAIGRAFNAQRSNSEAMEAYETAARLGDPTAMNNIGAMLQFGDLGTVNETEAVDWFRKSASLGDQSGMYNLAVNLLTGKGVSADPAEAFSWMRRSAEAGYAPAQSQLGAMYESGSGTVKDEAAALQSYLLAAGQSYGPAFYSLAVMYDAGRGTPVNTEQAADYMIAAIGFGAEEAKRDVEAGAMQWSDAFRKAVQRRLKEKIGVYKGEVDGVFGAGVREAVATVFGSAK